MCSHCILDPYKIEVFKGCWHAQLCSLKAANFGELPEDKVEELYSTYKCKFGCPPPLTPAAIFVNMHEVPRPKKSPGVAKYESFEDTYGTCTPIDLPELKPDAAREIAPPGVLDKDRVQGVIACTCCKRLRCVYVKMKLSAVTIGAPPGCTLKDVLDRAIDANAPTYTCGADLDLRGFEALDGLRRPYVRLKLDCSQHVELQLYSSAVLPKAVTRKICGYCGEEGSERDPENEAAILLPVCDPCVEQHKKARASGRQVARFDRSGHREHHAQAALRREGQVNEAAARARAAEPQLDPPAKRPRQQASVERDDGAGPTQEHGLSMGSSSESEAEEEVEDEQGTVNPNEDPDYFVHKIHNVRYKNRRLEYYIEWEDFPRVEDYTWEPTANLPAHMVRDFKAAWLAEGKVWPTPHAHQSTSA